MKLIHFGLVAALILMAPFAAQSAPRMIQCESCATAKEMKSVAARQGDGEYYIFSLSRALLLRFRVQYDGETGAQWIYSPTPPPNVENAFALMLDANQLKPHVFAGQQTFRGDINKIGGGAHDPVAISLNGEHDSAYGSFIHYSQSCLDSRACADGISPVLGKIAGAESLLNSIGISIMGNGGSISWENLPPHFKLWLCNSNNDCALLQYDEDKGWSYVESRSEGGLGKRYPKYGERLKYKFNNSGEASMFDRGLRNGGARVSGSYSTTNTILACVNVDGTAYCEYITYLE